MYGKRKRKMKYGAGYAGDSAEKATREITRKAKPKL